MTSWEDGQVLSKSGSFAGNANALIAPGVGRKYKILYFACSLVAVGAANRYIRLRIVDSVGNLLGAGIQSVTAITAGQTKTFGLGCFVYNPNATYGSTPTCDGNADLGENSIMKGTDQLVIDVVGGLAADTLTYYGRVIELPE